MPGLVHAHGRGSQGSLPWFASFLSLSLDNEEGQHRSLPLQHQDEEVDNIGPTPRYKTSNSRGETQAERVAKPEAKNNPGGQDRTPAQEALERECRMIINVERFGLALARRAFVCQPSQARLSHALRCGLPFGRKFYCKKQQ